MSATRMGARRRTVLAAVIVIALAAAAAAAAGAAANGPRTVVRTVKSAKLNTTILVDLKGRTLYQLSVERNGKFICTDKACLSVWHPLVVPRGVTPRGTTALAVVRRPDGRTQVTFRGAPLYTFAGDTKRGDVMGEGLKDVGTWRAASLKRTAAPAPSPGGGYPYP